MVRAFVARQDANGLVIDRRKRNLADSRPPITRERFWYSLVLGLLTSQQRSGPTSPVQRFLNTRPFPLAWSACENAPDIEHFARTTIRQHGGIRFADRIAGFLARNRDQLQDQRWSSLAASINRLTTPQTIAVERDVAHLIDERFWGVGPKQSRNILQEAGLIRWLIPIDSRIVKWLSEHRLIANLSARSLGDLAYYEFVEDGVIALCAAAGVEPCIFDAAVFAKDDAPGAWDAYTEIRPD
jgi:thermostable 8-oxoguanine DNA glycosylase